MSEDTNGEQFEKFKPVEYCRYRNFRSLATAVFQIEQDRHFLLFGPLRTILQVLNGIDRLDALIKYEIDLLHNG